MRVVTTAGHVDHGKSTLVHALTGIDPDRLAEEKARGLTIDLGFAWTTLPSGEEIAFVDVPGHVRFIKNMIAGVGAVDACLFVLAAPEGWKPQSEEHLRILEMMGIGHGVIALTKADGLDDEVRELARLDLSERVAGSFLEKADVVEVDAPSGMGLAQLRAALDGLVSSTPAAADCGRPRLWIDRSFAARGSGTVVTGTLAGGSIAVDDELVVLGPGNSTGRRHARGSTVRVRALQSHQRQIASASPGRRVAVNLVGVGHESVRRGDALVRPVQWERSNTVDCSLSVLEVLDHDVSRRGAYHAYIGSGEHAVRLRVLGSSAIAPGEQGMVRLHLPCPLPLVLGDRYVLREAGRSETVGGGEILDVAPVLPASRAVPDRRLSRVVAERGWVEVALFERLTGQHVTPNVGARWVVDPAELARTEDGLRAAVSQAGALGLDLASLDERRRAVIESMDDIECEAGRAWRRGGRPPSVALAQHPWLTSLRKAPFSPPAPASVERATLRQMVRAGLVVESAGVYFTPEAIEQAAEVVGELLDHQPSGVTASQIREALGTTRKYVLPLLAQLDANGVTRRRGDLRIAGPRSTRA